MTKPDSRDPANWIPRDLFAEYVGRKSTSLLKYYDKAATKRNPMAMSFDIFAVFAFPAWVGYRRQATMWMAFTGLIATATLAESAFDFRLPNVAIDGVGFALGLMARGVLLSTATKHYQTESAQGRSDEEIRETLQGRAAPSIPLAIAGGLGSLLIISGAAFVGEILFGG